MALHTPQQLTDIFFHANLENAFQSNDLHAALDVASGIQRALNDNGFDHGQKDFFQATFHKATKQNSDFKKAANTFTALLEEKYNEKMGFIYFNTPDTHQDWNDPKFFEQSPNANAA